MSGPYRSAVQPAPPRPPSRPFVPTDEQRMTSPLCLALFHAGASGEDAATALWHEAEEWKLRAQRLAETRATPMIVLRCGITVPPIKKEG